jgi:DnaJ-class molecular chaperone
MNPYEVLGLSVECTQEEITIAYRALAKKHHPDVGGDQTIFIQLSIAVEVLRDPHKRKLFDEFGIVMDATESMITAKVEELFADIINQWVDSQINSGKEINLQFFFETGFNANESQLRNTINKNTSLIKVLQKRKKSITTTDTINKVTAILDKRIMGLQSIVKAAEEEKHIMHLVKELCAMYNSEEEPTVLYGKETLVPKDFIREMMNGGRVHSAYTTYTTRGF